MRAEFKSSMSPINPSAVRRVAVFAAMQWECRPVLRNLRQVQRDKLGSFTVWRATSAGHEVTLVKTGIGVRLAAQAIDALLAQGEFDLIISTGCAGGLSPAAAPGDLAIATFAVCAGSGQRFATDVGFADQMTAVAEQAKLTAHRGPMLCVDDAFTTATAKRAAAALGHVAVEMEGVAIAARAAMANIPFIAVRSILDDAETEMHDGGFVDPASGQVKPLALAKYLVRRPGAIRDLLAMQKMMQAAESSLDRLFKVWFSLFDRPSSTV